MIGAKSFVLKECDFTQHISTKLAFSPAKLTLIVALGREELVTRFVAKFGAAKPFPWASPSTVVIGGFIRINFAPEYPLVGWPGFEFRATKGVFSFMGLVRSSGPRRIECALERCTGQTPLQSFHHSSFDRGGSRNAG